MAGDWEGQDSVVPLPLFYSDHVGIFPSMWEFFHLCGNFFRLCGNFSDHVPFPRRNFSHHVGIFPTMSEFFPIPILYAGKNPLLVDGRAPRSIWCKKTLWVAVKIFLLLLRKSSVMCKAISQKSAETVSFFLQCNSSVVMIYAPPHGGGGRRVGELTVPSTWIHHIHFPNAVPSLPTPLVWYLFL